MGAPNLRISQSRSVRGGFGAGGNTFIPGTQAKLRGQGVQLEHDTGSGRGAKEKKTTCYMRCRYSLCLE